jgi:alcohol dehydrogenase class IV
MASDDILQFFMPTRIHYHNEVVEQLPTILGHWGKRIVLVTVRHEMPDPAIVHEIRSILENSLGTVILYDDVEAHPDSDDLDSAAYYIRQTDCDIVLGVGGVESVNMAKALALMIPNDSFCAEFLRHDKEPKEDPIPCITMPLYPLFGAEIVPTITLLDAEDGQKKIFAHEKIFPALTIVDPNVTVDLEKEITASTSIGIVSAGVETLLSRVSNDITNTLALRSIELVFRSLPRALKEPKNLNHRTNLFMASLLVGMGYANSSLGTCQALAMAINSYESMPEDILMGILLPHVMEYNLTASPAKYVQLARIVDKTDTKDITVIEAAIKAVEGVRRLYSEIDFPTRLSELGLEKSQFPGYASLAAQYDFLKNTPRPLNKDEIETILIAAQ